MSSVHEFTIKCSVCFGEFDLRRAPPVLHVRRLKTHEVRQCPHCGYLVATLREAAIV